MYAFSRIYAFALPIVYRPQFTTGIRYVEVLPPSGWQTMAKNVREIDEDKVRNCKEDIDTLLVFVSLVIPYTPQPLSLTGNRLVYSQQLSPLSLSSPTRICNNSQRISQTKYSSTFQHKSRVSLSTGTSSIPPCQTSPLHPSRGLGMPFSSTSSGSSASSSLL